LLLNEMLSTPTWLFIRNRIDRHDQEVTITTAPPAENKTPITFIIENFSVRKINVNAVVKTGIQG
jgi:hypothetical protein